MGISISASSSAFLAGAVATTSQATRAVAQTAAATAPSAGTATGAAAAAVDPRSSLPPAMPASRSAEEALGSLLGRTSLPKASVLASDAPLQLPLVDQLIATKGPEALPIPAMSGSPFGRPGIVATDGSTAAAANKTYREVASLVG